MMRALRLLAETASILLFFAIVLTLLAVLAL
jgi:hypothetical protein